MNEKSGDCFLYMPLLKPSIATVANIKCSKMHNFSLTGLRNDVSLLKCILNYYALAASDENLLCFQHNFLTRLCNLENERTLLR